MPYYIQMGEVPRKRHVQYRRPDGGLYREEVFGNEGFSGPSSTLYHRHAPTQVAAFQDLGAVRPEPAEDPTLRHRHLKTAGLPAGGDPVQGRIPLLYNDDLTLCFCRPTDRMEYYYKNAEGDELLYIHSGSGHLETTFGVIAFFPGDYLIVPRGTIFRICCDAGDTRFLVIESASAVEVPRRYRNAWGQCLEHSPYCERDIRGPAMLAADRDPGRYEVRIRSRGRLAAYWYDFCPLDVVGWDGYVYPWAFSIHDFEPITGRVHQPPTVHQTFQAHNYVVCSFVPRLLDYHPQAIPVPYFHSNLESDEVIYYVNGNFGSRRGIEEGSLTLHPLGLPHGPQPGIIEASLGATRTEELAVMVDTFRPLRPAAAALTVDDPHYPLSWLP